MLAKAAVAAASAAAAALAAVADAADADRKGQNKSELVFFVGPDKRHEGPRPLLN